MKVSFILLIMLSCLLSNGQFVDKFDPNYDESKVPEFVVTDPLTTYNGRKEKNIRIWQKQRRSELLNFFTENVYGRVPGELKISEWKVVERGENAVNGKAVRKQVDILFEKENNKLHFNVLIYLPKDIVKPPLFLGYNFYGNHTITDDVNVLFSDAWVRDNPSFGIINNQLTEQSRGVRINRWAVEKIIDAGYGLASIYYGEVDPD